MFTTHLGTLGTFVRISEAEYFQLLLCLTQNQLHFFRGLRDFLYFIIYSNLDILRYVLVSPLTHHCCKLGVNLMHKRSCPCVY